MVEGVEYGREPASADRLFGSWRVVVSAWALVVLLVILLVGVEALASRHAVSPRHPNLAGVVIPRHDPACAARPSAECGLGSSLEEAARYGYPLW